MSKRHAARAKTPKLIVMAFDRDEEGELQPVFGPADQHSEERAIRVAKGLAPKHVGMIAWSREAHPDIGEYGPPTTLFVSGDVPEIDWPRLPAGLLDATASVRRA